MPEIWYGGFFMTVALHGMNYRYRFRVKGKRYFGLCVNCHTEEEALAFEAQERNVCLPSFTKRKNVPRNMPLNFRSNRKKSSSTGMFGRWLKITAMF